MITTVPWWSLGQGELKISSEQIDRAKLLSLPYWAGAIFKLACKMKETKFAKISLLTLKTEKNCYKEMSIFF